jgi:hypothetical protein
VKQQQVAPRWHVLLRYCKASAPNSFSFGFSEQLLHYFLKSFVKTVLSQLSYFLLVAFNKIATFCIQQTDISCLLLAETASYLLTETSVSF